MDDEALLRRELGAHLRAMRAIVTPRDVGLAGGGRRRAPGLRREEAAALAGVSVAWYTWLEQGRVSTSRHVLDAICRALLMPDDAHRHTLALAGFLPRAARTAGTAGTDAVAGHVDAATLALLDAWTDTPAPVLDERFDILAANAAYRSAWGDPQHLPTHRRNLLVALADPTPALAPAPTPTPTPDAAYRIEDPEPLLRALYEQFRAATAHLPDDARAAEIVRLLHEVRPDAEHWWHCRAVSEFRPLTVELAAADPARGPLQTTFALLRPVANARTLVLVQTPATPLVTAA
ncbi:helix-turn-helix domain-containing protein [Yinghuangia soli]|uniref:Helix-turn-helix transcriptional regulator n=1 Tax=Yinghuangia soli TaxID=2908204 RepID=A0AA41QA24_9ACTN|nr:helix-turn-helix domain-containing protein [Yinghuangia soli]MCF2533996.1 helix-turn-helix transcriptional regulator [Yinghuangia soli]